MNDDNNFSLLDSCSLSHATLMHPYKKSSSSVPVKRRVGKGALQSHVATGSGLPFCLEMLHLGPLENNAT